MLANLVLLRNASEGVPEKCEHRAVRMFSELITPLSRAVAEAYSDDEVLKAAKVTLSRLVSGSSAHVTQTGESINEENHLPFPWL